MSSSKFWIIVGPFGAYTGSWHLRKDAIKTHCEQLGKTWKQCRHHGDRAVMAKLVWKGTIKRQHRRPKALKKLE